ncbi:MAG: oligosaccharide flippase family protein, partial [Planctomycetota bacterium]
MTIRDRDIPATTGDADVPDWKPDAAEPDPGSAMADRELETIETGVDRPDTSNPATLATGKHAEAAAGAAADDEEHRDQRELATDTQTDAPAGPHDGSSSSPSSSDTNSQTGPVGSSTTAAKTLRQKAVQGSVLWLSVYAILQVIRLGSNFALMALLTPAMFGVVRLATVVVQGLKMFSEVGIRHSIIRHERGDDPDFLNTAFTMQAGRGVVLWLIATGLAWPIAAFYDESMLLAIMPAVAVGALLGGFYATSFATLNRHLDEWPRARLELWQTVVTRTAMIAWALIWPSAWALVVGTLLGNLFFLIYSHLRLPGIRNRFRWDKQAAREIWSFGLWILIGTIIAFFGQQLDSLMLGKLEAMAALGIYGIALTVARLPHELTSQITVHILYPVMSEINRSDAARFAQRVRKIRSAVLSAGIFLTLGVIVTAPWFFRLFQHAWWDITWIAPLSAITVWIMIANGPVNRALLTLGKSREL